MKIILSMYYSYRRRSELVTITQLNWSWRENVSCLAIISYEPFSLSGWVNDSANSIYSGQPAQSAQADLSRNFLLSVNFLHVTGQSYLQIADRTNSSLTTDIVSTIVL